VTTPSAPTLALAAASDSGVQGDHITNVVTPTLTGTGVAGDIVTILDGTTPTGTATVAADGNWSTVSSTLADGAHNLTATQSGTSGNVSPASPVLALTIGSTLPAIPTLVLDPASDSGVKGDDRTNIAKPVITGTAEGGTTVTLTDAGTVLGTTMADTGGTWSITAGTPLNEGANSLTATSTDAAGSSASGSLTVTLDTTAPTVTDTLGTDGVTVTGAGDPNTPVTISEGGTVVGTAQGDAAGASNFDATSLAPGAHSLVATQTDAAGNTGSAAALAVTVTDPRFNLVDSATSASSLLRGSDYAGPVNHLQAAYDHSGAAPSVISALVGDVFIQSGAGANAEAAKSGNNVLSGGNGSSWLVGADGSDGGTDTFFLSAQGGQPAWDTLVNFHVGDMLTLWGFNSASGSTTSVGIQGTSGGEGETLSVDFGGGAGASTLVTFAGLSSSAQFTTSNGSTGGLDFSMLTRTA
jgi:large repetitive protein